MRGVFRGIGGLGGALLSLGAQADSAAATADPASTPLSGIALERPAAAPPGAGPAQEAGAVEELVVTAQKREELLREVPISLQAYQGADLEARGIETTRQLDRLVPSLQFAAIASFPLVFIRGLGSDNFVPSADPSIATYIDGIYVPNGAGAVQSLSLIRRVEVLKGPQGSLFGRNATGGAINVVTLDPGDTREASLQAQVGRFDLHRVQAAAAGPLTDWLSASLSGETLRSDPYYTAVRYEIPREKLDNLRAKIALRLSDDARLSLSSFHAEQSGLFQMTYQNVNPSALGTAAGIRAEKDDRVAEVDLPGLAASRQTVHAAILDWALPAFDLRVLASDQDHVGRGQLDFDASAVPAAGLSTRKVFTRLQTGELQVLSNDASWAADQLDWVAGLYALRSSAGFDPVVLRTYPGLLAGLLEQPGDPALAALGANLEQTLTRLGLGLGNTPLGEGGLSINCTGVLDTRSYSAYVDGTWHLTERMDLTLGGRLQHEKRYLTQARTEVSDFSGEGSLGGLPFELQSARETNFAPRVVLGFRPDARTLVYLSSAMAYKSGTYNIINVDRPPNYLVPERVLSVEVGAKLERADGRLRLDMAAFDSRIRNLQSGFTSLQSGGVVQFFSVPRARTRGAEANLRWIPLPRLDPGLSLLFNGAYVDAVYREFRDGPGFEPGTGAYDDTFDHSGNRLTYTPAWSGNASLIQRVDLAGGALLMGLDGSYTGRTYPTAQNTEHQGGYALLDTRVGYLHAASQIELSAYCSNLLDRDFHVLVGRNDFGEVRTLAAPREYGVRLAWAF